MLLLMTGVTSSGTEFSILAGVGGWVGGRQPNSRSLLASSYYFARKLKIQKLIKWEQMYSLIELANLLMGTLPPDNFNNPS